MLQLDAQRPEDVPDGWMVHLEVSDIDRTAACAVELGGSVSVPPVDVPHVGRLAVLSDPEGALLSVFQAA
jgi:predicted enzyme related to lactoylglutathione lyase